MNKYEKILNKIGQILGFSLFVILALVLVAMPTVVLITQDDLIALVVLLEICTLIAIYCVSYGIGLFFFKDRYKPTGYVSEGQSLNWPEKTRIYVKRNMITNLIEIIACAAFAVLYIVLLCLGIIVTSICGLVMSAVAFVIFFLFYKKQQHQLKEMQESSQN